MKTIFSCIFFLSYFLGSLHAQDSSIQSGFSVRNSCRENYTKILNREKELKRNISDAPELVSRIFELGAYGAVSNHKRQTNRVANLLLENKDELKKASQPVLELIDIYSTVKDGLDNESRIELFKKILKKRKEFKESLKSILAPLKMNISFNEFFHLYEREERNELRKANPFFSENNKIMEFDLHPKTYDTELATIEMVDGGTVKFKTFGIHFHETDDQTNFLSDDWKKYLELIGIKPLYKKSGSKRLLTFGKNNTTSLNLDNERFETERIYAEYDPYNSASSKIPRLKIGGTKSEMLSRALSHLREELKKVQGAIAKCESNPAFNTHINDLIENRKAGKYEDPKTSYEKTQNRR